LAGYAGRAGGASVDDFLDFTYNLSGSLLPGRLYVPPEAIADPVTPRPLILFLHGAGEIGTNNLNQISINIDALLGGAKAHGVYLYAPQTAAFWNPPVTDLIELMLERALAEHNVDATRLYVTGASRGGGGTWNVLNRLGDRFAAGVPICATAPEADFAAASVIDESVWAFHARNDATVPVVTTRDVVRSLLTAAGETLPAFPPLSNTTTTFELTSTALDLKYTEFPTGGHDIWNRVYSDEATYEWMFAHALPEPGTWVLAAVGLSGLTLCALHRQRSGRAPPRRRPTSPCPNASIG
jgi:predicted peptidase